MRIVDVAVSFTNTLPVVPAFTVNVVAFVLIPFPLIPIPPEPAVILTIGEVIWLAVLPLEIDPLPAATSVTEVAPLTVSAVARVPRTIEPLPVVIVTLN